MTFKIDDPFGLGMRLSLLIVVLLLHATVAFRDSNDLLFLVSVFAIPASAYYFFSGVRLTQVEE